MQPERMDPQVLLLASRFDLACDYVVSQLRRRRASYFRLNTEDLDQFAIVAFPDEPSVLLISEFLEIHLTQPQLKAIYFRRGVYPREAFTPQHSPDEQLIRTHRSAFMRSFMAFDSCQWMNHPARHLQGRAQSRPTGHRQEHRNSPFLARQSPITPQA